jgi:hypothetical protein
LRHAIDENVDAPVGFPYVIKECSDLIRISNIGGKVVAVDFPGNFLGIFLVARMNDHLRAFARKGAHDGQTDIMCRARDQSDFILQEHLRPPYFFS